LTWFLTTAAVGIWLFRKAIGRLLQPYLPDRRTRHQVLGFIIVAFAITAAARLVARYF